MAETGRGVALVLEGGGYRGVFTAGVLDVLMERGIYGFESVWGTSAGALNALSYRSRQIGRTIRIMLAFRDDKRLMSVVSLATTGDMAGGDFLYRKVQDEIDPCDLKTFNESPLRMFTTATDKVFGTAHYFEVKRLPDDIDKVRASAAIPLVSHSVIIGGHRYLDGGTTDSVPIEVALGIDSPSEVVGYVPAERAVVVLTRHRAYVKGRQFESLTVMSRRYQDYPAYVEALANRAERYMVQRERIWDLEREGKILVLAPPAPVTVTSSEHDGEPLLSLYIQGRNEAEEHIDQITTFLK